MLEMSWSVVTVTVDVEEDLGGREEQPVLRGAWEVPKDTFEGVPMLLVRIFGGYRQAVDNKVYV